MVALTDNSLRTYRVGRVAEARALDERFERPEGFDLGAFWTESSAAYERDAPRVEVTVRIREDRVGWLRRAVGGPTIDRAERLAVDDPDGWRHLRLKVDWPSEAAAVLLSVGEGLEVLDPPEVRAADDRARARRRSPPMAPCLGTPPASRSGGRWASSRSAPARVGARFGGGGHERLLGRLLGHAEGVDTVVAGDLAFAIGVDESGEIEIVHRGTPWFRCS